MERGNKVSDKTPDEMVAELEAVVARMTFKHDHPSTKVLYKALPTMKALQAERDEARAELRESEELHKDTYFSLAVARVRAKDLEEALAPFVAAADEINDSFRDDVALWTLQSNIYNPATITVGHVRNARKIARGEE